MGVKEIMWLNEISRGDLPVVGEKATYLAEMLNQQLPVPPGFVLTAQIYEHLAGQIKERINAVLSNTTLNFNSLSLAHSEITKLFASISFPEELKAKILAAYRKLGNSLEKIYPNLNEKTIDLISSGRDLPFIAVRASPSKALPKQLKPKLDVKGIEQLILAIKECWASFFSPRAIYLRSKKGVSWDSVSLPILIQKAILPVKSGDLFTINPISNDKEQMLIQTIWGANQGFISNPTLLVVNKSSGEIIEASINTQLNYLTRTSQGEGLTLKPLPSNIQSSQILSRNELEGLTKLAAKIENLFNFPQHVEWAIEKDKIFILQTSKITDIFKTPLKRTLESSEIKGIFVSFGFAEGKSKLLLSNADVNKIEQGDIIVAKDVNENIFPALMNCSALITDNSGLTSYAAVVSKELEIPCLIATKTGTETIPEDKIITIDSNTGVHIKEELAEHVVKEELGYEQNQFKELGEYIKKLEQYIAELVYREAERRKSGEPLSPDEEIRARTLSEIEWQIRDVRQKLQKLAKKPEQNEI